MSRIIKEMHVLVGLPGSGKTTFAEQYNPAHLDRYHMPKAKKPAYIVDYDEIYRQVGLASDLTINKDKIEKINSIFFIVL